METLLIINSEKNATYKEALKHYLADKPIHLSAKRVNGVLQIRGVIRG